MYTLYTQKKFHCIFKQQLFQKIAKIFLTGVFGAENVEIDSSFFAVCGDFIPLRNIPHRCTTVASAPSH